MTNLNRLKLSLANKQYFSDEEYTVFLDENGLTASDECDGNSNLYKKNLLLTQVAVFEALINDIDLFMKIQTEFTTTYNAYKNIKDRIDELKKQIANVPLLEEKKFKFIYL